MELDLDTVMQIARAYADLGDAIGGQWSEAVTQFDAYGSQEPISDSESNPNAFAEDSYEAIRRFRYALGRSGIDGADEFLSLVDAELEAAPAE
jgi:hypothetical protein